jgi:hypothetical protein
LQAASPPLLAGCNPAAGTCALLRPGTGHAEPAGMFDFLLVLAGSAFFGLSWGYTLLCEKL